MSDSHDDPFASAALYRKKGWIGTLPLPYGKKKSPPSGFTGESGAWPTPANIDAWARDGRQNIGLRLPPNVIALDVDEPTEFLILCELLGSPPPTWCSQGRRARLGHFYYRLPAGVTSKGWSNPCPGVDLLRYGHRYSLVWPSRHHEEPVNYRWLRPDGTEADDAEIPGPGELPELPAPWVDYLSGAETDQGDSVAHTTDKLQRDDFGTVGDPIPAGSHQDYLFRYASSLRARGVPEEEAAALVRLRARNDCKPPWAGPDDPWDAVSHAYKRYEAGTPADAPWPAYDAAVEALADGQNHPGIGTVLPDPSRFTFLDWFELASTPPEPVDWFVPGVIAARRGHVLYSETGLGKSLLTLEWAVSMVRAGRTVLYVDHENDPRGDVWDRLHHMRVSPAELAGLRYLSFPEMSPLDSPAGGAELFAIAREVSAEIVIVDTATRTVKGEENSNDTWSAWDRNTGVKLRKAGIGFLRIDHSGKNSERGQRGGSNKSTDVDLVWKLEKTGDEEFLLTNEKARIPVPEKLIGLRRERVPNLRHDRTAPPSKLEKSAARLRRIWQQMDEAGVEVNPLRESGTPKGVIAIRNEMRAHGIKGYDEELKAVAESRWAAMHNAFVERPEWAPPIARNGQEGEVA